MDNIQLTALVPEQMKVAQDNLIEWCSGKINSINSEIKELKESVEHARQQKWAVSTLKRQQSRAEKRILFFDKIQAALKAGFVIVPNFPVTLFAIRTNRDKPLTMFTNRHWDDKEQKPMELPTGEGEYQNPFPIVERETESLADNKTRDISYATDWAELEFPISMMKPEIIEATNKAMALQIFDQFGILPKTRNEDPIIVGQIVNKSGAYRSKIVSFMIAWHFDTKVL